MSLTYLYRGLRAEALKLRRSLALVLALVIPLFPAGVDLASVLRSGLPPAIDEADALGPWALYFRYAIKLWVIFALPTVVAILAALVANVDHKPKQWKQLFAMPFPRPALYAAKWVSLAGITLLSTLTFAVANVLGGLIVSALRPELGMGLKPPLSEVLGKPLLAWALALCMVSIHQWIAWRWPSFVTSLAVGFAASIANLFLLGSYLYDRAMYFPWAMPVYVYDDWRGSLIASLAGAVLILGVGLAGFVRRDVF